MEYDSDDEFDEIDQEEQFLVEYQSFKDNNYLERKLIEYNISTELSKAIINRSRNLDINVLNTPILIAAFVVLNKSGFKINKDTFSSTCDEVIKNTIRRDININNSAKIKKDILRYCRHILKFT
jgi:hypothetical protein